MQRPYDFHSFIQKIKDKDYFEIIKDAEEEVKFVESISYRKKGAVKAREMGSTNYDHKIKEFLFWMRHGVKPGSSSESDFQLYQIVAEKLVEKGQFKSSILEMFNKKNRQ